MFGWTVRWSWSCHPTASQLEWELSSEGNKMGLGYQSLVLSPSSATMNTWGMYHGDQLRGYYSCRTKSRKFYKYIFTFLLDVAITNAFILMKHYCPSCPFANIKSFRLQLAKELMAEYCSCCRRGRGGTVIRPLPYRHFSITMEDEKNAPR